jgi:hypothetical protein
MPEEKSDEQETEVQTREGYTEDTFLEELREPLTTSWESRPGTLVGERNGRPVLIYEVKEGPTPKDIVCFDCGHRLIAYRKVASPHFKHAPGAPDDCPGRGPEGALHSLVKQWLARELEAGGSSLLLSVGCSKHENQLGPRLAQEFQVVWSSIRMERVTGTIRPDIVLLKDDELVAAIEVEVSNPVSEEKADKFRSLELPWFEVRAATLLKKLDLEAPDELWEFGLDKFRNGIPTAKFEHSAGSWSCPVCLAALHANGDVDAGRKRAAVLRKRRTRGLLFSLWSRRSSIVFRDRESSLELLIAVVDGEGATEMHESESTLWGLYMGEDLYPLLELLPPEEYSEITTARMEFRFVLRRFYAMLREHGVEMRHPDEWSQRDLYRLPALLKGR